MKAPAFILLICLSACASPPPAEPKIQVVKETVPMPVPCVSDKTPREPTYPDSDAALKAESPAAMLRRMAAGRLLRIQRAAETEPVLDACRELTPPH